MEGQLWAPKDWHFTSKVRTWACTWFRAHFPISGLNCICKFPFTLKGNIFTVSEDTLGYPSSNTAFFFSFCLNCLSKNSEYNGWWGKKQLPKKSIEIPQGQWFILEAEKVSLSHQGTSWSWCRMSRMVLWGMTLIFGRSRFQLQLHQSHMVSEKSYNLWISVKYAKPYCPAWDQFAIS